MSVGKCIRGKMASGTISEEYGKELLQKIDEVENMIKEFPQMETNKAFDDMVERVKNWQINKKRYFIKNKEAEARLIKQAKAHKKGYFDGLCSTLTYDLAGRADGLNVDKLAETVRAQSFGQMPTIALNMTVGKLSIKKNVEGGKKFIKALFGDESDEMANKMAQEWQTVSKQIRDRFVRAGGDIGELKDWKIPTTHDSRLINDVSKEEWVEFTFPLLDRKKMIDRNTGWPMSKATLKEALGQAYETLRSNGLNKYSAGNTPLAEKYSGSRFLHFKDGESWLSYNDRFGNGDPMQTVGQYVNNMANDIAFMEVWGPDPEGLKNKLLGKAKIEAALQDRKSNIKALKKIDYFERIWDEVSGEAAIPVQTNLAFAKFNSGVRNLLMSAQLGSAFLTQMSDVATNMWTAQFNGLSKSKVLSNLFSLMTSNKKRDFAMHLGLGADEIATILSGRTGGSTRFLGDLIPEEGWTGRLASTVIKASLLERMTMASKKAFSLDFVHTLANNADTQFSSLIKPLKDCFERYGLTSKDWDIIRKSKLDDLDGAKYVNIIEIAKSGHEDVANKLSNMIFTERDFAVIDSNPRTRALLFQGHKRGSFMGEMLRYAAMYKTFPITILTHHISRTIDIEGAGSKLGYAGGLFAAMTLSGYFTLQSKLIVSGKKPAKADEWNTWRDAMLAGGALGVMGDIFVGETRGNFIGDKLLAVAGPGFSLAKDTYDLTLGNIAQAMSKKGKSNFWGDAAVFAKRYAPFTNLWYTKLATERYLTDKLQMLADKKTRERFQNRERQQRYRYGRGYWWKPGANKPNI